MRSRASLLLAFVLALPIEGASGQTVLVREGQPASTIVVADQPHDSARRGAQLLQEWLRRVSGATVPIQSESALGDSPGASLILVGDSRRARALGIDADRLALEEIVIRTVAGGLVIVGDDQRPDGMALDGTRMAVLTFVADVLGVRLLWPGEYGTVVPRGPDIVVDLIDRREAPVLKRRRIRNMGHNSRLQQQLDQLGWSAPDFEAFLTESEEWFDFHRFGGSFQGDYTHAYGDYWERFRVDHPEWFAMQPDGSRDNSAAQEGRRARLCVSNQALVDQIARESIRALEADRMLDARSISPNDGGRATYCLCPRCEAMDAVEADSVFIWSPDGGLSHLSLTDRYVRFYNAVTERVVAALPGRLLGAYAYAAYHAPPLHVKLHPGVVIGFVPRPHTYLNDDARERMLADWSGWSQVAERLFLRPNYLMGAHSFPAVFPHRLAADLASFASTGMLLGDFDCCYHYWATNGLNYYVLARLLWNPQRDVEEVIAEYCQDGFGPAAGPVRAYFDRLEQVTCQVAASRQYLHWKKNPEVVAAHYTDELLEELRGLLEEADGLAAGDPEVKGRITFLRTGLEYVPVSREYLLARAAARDGEPDAGERLQQAERLRRARFEELGYTWALSVPLVSYHRF